MCLKIDLRKSEVTTAVNGNLLRTVVGKKIGNSPSLLYMVLGRSKNYQFVEKQFQGSVSNIQLYTNSTNLTITALSSEPCRVEGDLVAWHPGDWRVEGDLLAWHPGDWRVEGDRWLLVEETGDNVCDQGESYTVAIPVEMTIHEAMNVCRKKLNNSTMPYQENQNSLKSFTGWYDNITSGICKSVWTPFTDEENEGIFLNMNDGTEAKYLQWKEKQPDGGNSENYVSNSLQTSLYGDSGREEQYCTSCLLNRSLLLRLDGLCEHSYIGDKNISLFFYF